MRFFNEAKQIFTGLLLLIVSSTFSQVRQLGTWRMFLPYGASIGAFDAGDKVYSATNFSIFSYEKSTGVIQTYDKASGLSDIGIQTVNYDSADTFLAIAYTDNNIDFMYNGTDVYNLPDIMNQSQAGSVTINSFSFFNGMAYISSSIGISVVDLKKMEIHDTYIIGANGIQTNVFATSTDGVTIYAATAEGVKYAPFNSPNLNDFGSWSVFNSTQGIPALPAKLISVFNNNVYAVIPADSGTSCDTLYQYNGTTWSKIYDASSETFASLGPVNGNLYFTTWVGGSQANLGKIDRSGILTTTPAVLGTRAVTWFESAGVIWIGDAYKGLIKNNSADRNFIQPNGPGGNAAFRMDVKNHVLNVATGGATENWGPLFLQAAFYIYKDNVWINHNGYTDPVLSSVDDIVSVASIPALNVTYFGSFLQGLIRYDNQSENITVFDLNNTNGWLQTDQNDPGRTKISCMTVDQYNNLWMCNSGALQPIKMLEADGSTRKGFSLPYSIQTLKQMIIDENNQIWAPARGGGIGDAGGLLVWSYNGTLDNTSDDVSRLLTVGAGQGNLPDVGVNCVIEDKDGNIWTGTNQGIAVFYCAGSVLTSYGCDAEQIKVTQNGFVGYLFGMQSVLALAVDAANRKWVGTSEGVWLISADGQTQLLNFTTSNSPLPSNTITDIKIDDQTGEVFIGTSGGLVSYQGDAIDTCIDCKQALVYPNPVKPDYTGPIAIKGLADGAYVKITDVEGTLIFQGHANGAQMIWNGMGYNGNRAKSGVYLVFSSTDSGKERRVAKILITN
jgi:ligand-binding sensor domain-containing protein